MTATRTVEESRQDALESQHRLNHEYPQKHCIDQLNDPLPLCEQLGCFAPLRHLSRDVNHLKEKQQLEKKVANVKEQLEGAEAQLEAAQVAGTVRAKAYMYEDEGKKKWAVALDDAQGILEKANNELTAQVGQLEKKIQRQANENYKITQPATASRGQGPDIGRSG